MIAGPERIARDRATLAELEAEFAVNPQGLYVKENLASYRRRVAKYDANVPAPVEPGTPRVAAIVPEAPAPARALTGTREEQLQRVAAALGADHTTLAKAIASDITPDDFALECAELREAAMAAVRIAQA